MERIIPAMDLIHARYVCHLQDALTGNTMVVCFMVVLAHLTGTQAAAPLAHFSIVHRSKEVAVTRRAAARSTEARLFQKSNIFRRRQVQRRGHALANVPQAEVLPIALHARD